MVKTTLIAPHNKPTTRVMPNAGKLKQPMTITTMLPAIMTRVTTLGPTSSTTDHAVKPRTGFCPQPRRSSGLCHSIRQHGCRPPNAALGLEEAAMMGGVGGKRWWRSMPGVRAAAGVKSEWAVVVVLVGGGGEGWSDGSGLHWSGQ